eukprot:403337271
MQREEVKKAAKQNNLSDSQQQYQNINYSNVNEKKVSDNSLYYQFKSQQDSSNENTLGTMKHKMNICQWISFGFMLIVFLFLLGFLIYQWSTWSKVRINRYG